MKFILYICVATIILLVSCSDNGSNQTSDDKINVLYLMDSTGHYSQFGIEAMNGMKLAGKNSEKLNIITIDTKSDANFAIIEFNRIISEKKITAVITLTSWVSNAISPIAKQNNISHFAIGSAVFDNKSLNNTIRFTTDVLKESQYIQTYLNKFNKVAMMYFVNDYGIGWKNRMEQGLGNKLTKIVSYSDLNDDFTDELNSINTEKPDVLLLISTKEAAIIAKQAAQLGIKTQLVGVRPTFSDYLKDEPTAEGFIFSYPAMDFTNKLFADYQSIYGKKASAFSAEGYDLINSLIDAINLNKITNTEIFDFYKNKSYNGALGKITFDEFAQADYKFSLMKLTNKNYVTIE